MPLHDIKNIHDVESSDIKIKSKKLPDPAVVRLIMVLLSARYGDHAQMELTDFTSVFKNQFIRLDVPRNTPAAIGLKDLEKLYPNIGGHDGKSTFLDHHTVVLLQVTATVYNSVESFKYELMDFKIVNKDPRYVLKLDMKHQIKVKELVRELEKMDAIQTAINEEEVQGILNILSRSKKDDKEPNDDRSFKKPRLEGGDQESSNDSLTDSMLATNPMFMAPAISNMSQIPFSLIPASQTSTQIPYTMVEDTQETPTDDKHEKSILTTNVLQIQNASDLQSSQESIVDSLNSDDVLEVIATHKISKNPSTSVVVQSSQPEEPIKLKQNSEIILLSQGDSSTEEPAALKSLEVKREELTQSLPELQTAAVPTQVLPVSRQPSPEEEEEEVEHGNAPPHPEENTEPPREASKPTEETVVRNDHEQLDALPSSQNAIDEPEDAIEQYLRTTKIVPNKPMSFEGYIIGIDPLNSQVIGRSFKNLVKTTNFRIIISNVKRSKLKVFKINKNCLSIEMKSKEKILEFLGYEGNIDGALNDVKKIYSKISRLLNSEEVLMFNIVRRKINLSRGHQMVWECEDTIDDILESLERKAQE